MSIHAYAFLTDRYVLLPHGASIGDGYGPRIVARKNMSMDELAECTIAIPGKMTSAFLLLNLLLDKPKYKVIPFDEIIPAVLNGQVDAGLVIHEGQLTYEKAGLYLIKDLGEWWKNQTNLPVPLGGNVIRRDLGEKTISSVSKLLRQSIQYALDHRKEALEYAIQFAGELPYDLTDEFVGMYVNDFTLDYGELGKKAVQELLDRGYENGLIPKHVHAEFSE